MDNLLILGFDHVMPKLLHPTIAYPRQTPKRIYLIGPNKYDVAFRSNKVTVISFPFLRIILDTVAVIIIIVTGLILGRKSYIALYANGSTWHLMNLPILLFVFRILNLHVSFICRGNEIRNWINHPIAYKIIIKLCIFFSSKIYVKDPSENVAMIRRYNILGSKPYTITGNYLSRIEETDLQLRIARFADENISSHRILFLNSLKDFRNVPFTIELLSNLPSFFSLTIAGYRHGIDDDRLATLRADAAKANVLDRLCFLPFDPTTVNQLYNQHDLFILPANIIFANNSLLEAMYQGLVPLVFSRDQYSHRIVKDRDNGLSFSDLDSKEWSSKLLKLTADRKEFRKYRHNAIMHIHTNFTLKPMF